MSEKICAIIDCQGFLLEDKFYVRELAFVNKKNKLLFEVEQDFTRDLLRKSHNAISYQQNQLHGLPPEKTGGCYTIHFTSLQRCIEEIYYRVRTDDKPLFGIKNNHLAKLLKEFQIPYFNLETIGCPSLSTFDKFSPKTKLFCDLHAYIGQNDLRCSLRKCNHIWKWNLNKINFGNLVKEIDL